MGDACRPRKGQTRVGMVRRCGTQQWMVKIGEYLKCSKIDDGKVRGLGAHPMQCIFFSLPLGRPKARGWAALQGAWSWCRPGAEERIGI